MAIKIIPKAATKYPLWTNLLFYASLFLVVCSITSLFLVGHFQKKDLNRFQELEEAMAAQETAQEKELEQGVLNQTQTQKDFTFLFQGHRRISQCFNFLQAVSHPDIQFTSFDFMAKQSQVRLSGLTENFQTLGQQLLIFKEQSKIKNIKLSGISKGKEGKINFTFNLFLSPQVFSF